MRKTKTMKTTHSLNYLAAALVGALAFRTATLRAQAQAGSSKSSAELTKQEGAAPADDEAELAKKLQNPIASLISVPIQNNFDFGAGPNGDGFQYKVNIQPVIPITLSEDWNLITRTILPRRLPGECHRHHQPVGIVGHDGEPFLFAEGDVAWLHLGRRAGVAVPDRHGRFAGRREMGRWPDGRLLEAGARLDLRCAHKSHMVLRR
jgi:hypothetical protein